LVDYVTPWGAEPPECPGGGRARPMLEKYLEDGKLMRELPSVTEIREYVLRQLKELGVMEAGSG